MKRLGIALAALALVAVGCGGGDESDETATRATSPAATTASTRTATTAKASRPSPCPTKEEVGAALGSVPTSETPKENPGGWPSGSCLLKWEDGTSKADLRYSLEGPSSEAEAKRRHAQRREYPEKNLGPGKTYSEVTTINGLGLEAFYTKTHFASHGLHIRAEVPQYGQVSIGVNLSEETPATRGMVAKGREPLIALAKAFLAKIGA